MENDTCIHKYIPVFLKHFLSTEPEKPLLIATPFLVLYITWLIHTWHDLFTWVTWLILLLGRLLWKPRCPRSSAWHDSFIRDMPHSSFKRTRLIATPYLLLPVTITGESQGGFTCDSLGDVTWSHGTYDVRDLSEFPDRSLTSWFRVSMPRPPDCRKWHPLDSHVLCDMTKWDLTWRMT